MDWIHCNSCSRQPGDEKDRRFALTSCGHIYCDLCVEACTKDKCKVCDTKCNTVELAAKMQPDVQHFFTEPEDIINKALKIMQFQKDHRRRLTSHRRALVPRELAAREEIKRLKSRVSELEEKLKELKAVVMYYEKKSRPSSACSAKSPSSWSTSASLPTTPLSNGMSSQSPMIASPAPAAFYQQHSQQLMRSQHNQQTPQHRSQLNPHQCKAVSESQQHAKQYQSSSQQHPMPSHSQSQHYAVTQPSQKIMTQQQIYSQHTAQCSQKKNTPPQQTGAKRILESIAKLQQQQEQQQSMSPAIGDNWVTPNPVTLRKGGASNTPTYKGQTTTPPIPGAWNSPSNRSASQLMNPSLLKRLPGKISPYRVLNQGTQGAQTSPNLFPYLSPRPHILHK